MKNPVLIARSNPNSDGIYYELYMNGFRNGPAYGFMYRYDPRVDAKKNKVKVRLSEPLYMILLNDRSEWTLVQDPELLPSLWNPEHPSKMGEIISEDLERMFRNV